MTTATITQVLENENSTNAPTVPVYVGQEVPTPGGPDIIYHPDEAKWRARTARRLNEDVRANDVIHPDKSSHHSYICISRPSPIPRFLKDSLQSLNLHSYGKAVIL